VKSNILHSDMMVVEMDTVLLPCFTSLNETVSWMVRTVLHDDKIPRFAFIYSIDGLFAKFEKTGRFSVTGDTRYYNLTIVNVTVADAGEYKCSERAGHGPHSSVHLRVLGEVTVYINNNNYHYYHYYYY